MSFRRSVPFNRRMQQMPGVTMALAATTLIATLLVSTFGARAQAEPGRDGFDVAPPAAFDLPSPASAGKTRAAGRLQLEFPTRTVSLDVSLPPSGSTTGASVTFPRHGSVMTARTRADLEALRITLSTPALGQRAFAILVSGRNEELAHRRAQALRSEWIAKRHGSADRLVAAAFVSGEKSKQDNGTVRVEIVPLDAMRCGDCGQTDLRAIALDSGAAKLVRAVTEEEAALSASIVQNNPVHTTKLPPSRSLLDQTDIDRAQASPAKRMDRLLASVERPRRDVFDRHANAGLRSTTMTQDNCRRPRIIIDDYWRGGPIVSCDGLLRPH